MGETKGNLAVEMIELDRSAEHARERARQEAARILDEQSRRSTAEGRQMELRQTEAVKAIEAKAHAETEKEAAALRAQFDQEEAAARSVPAPRVEAAARKVMDLLRNPPA